LSLIDIYRINKQLCILISKDLLTNGGHNRNHRKRCYKENPAFQEIKPITFLTAFDSLLLRLWDEKRQMMIGFNEL